ncbi:hypothetical protein [Pseudomonas phage vB_PaeM_SIIA-P1]|uniref:Uncharacterized protein n=1 Tax=Pseudomonas phage vB_PaeM_SIIA-P1 TaxID=3114684 RepID=A0AAX4J7K1_9CAUD|nr:hypothetical protein [Pseudomonas phage vB_PaeM_SIIA-P1]
MEDLGKLSPKLSPRQHAVLLEMYRHPEHPVHRSPTNLTLKALRRKGLVELSWKDSVAGYMFGRQPCWNITDAGRRRILGVLGNNMEKEQSEDRPSIPEFEKTDANKLCDALEMISLLEKKLDESEKRGSELAASYCDGVVGDEYGHTYCRYKVERDAALAEVERLRESKGDPSGSFDRCMKMMYERDENAKRLDAALARIAELEAKLSDPTAVHQWQFSNAWFDGSEEVVLKAGKEGSPIRTLYAAPVAQAQHSAPDVCDGKEQDAFEEWARKEGLDTSCHPMHWLFLDAKTNSARQGWKAALRYVRAHIAAPSQAQHSVPEGWKLVPMDPTSQMTSVGQSLRYDAANSIGEIYRQMLDVAPSPIDPAAHPQPCQQPQAHPARCGCER